MSKPEETIAISMGIETVADMRHALKQRMELLTVDENQLVRWCLIFIEGYLHEEMSLEKLNLSAAEFTEWLGKKLQLTKVTRQ